MKIVSHHYLKIHILLALIATMTLNQIHASFFPGAHNPGGQAHPAALHAQPVLQPANEDSDQCSICLVDFNTTNPGELNEAIRPELECTHSYHITCILTWIRGNNKTCPICRAPMKIYDPLYLDAHTRTSRLVGLNRAPTAAEQILLDELRSYNNTVITIIQRPALGAIPLPPQRTPVHQRPVEPDAPALTPAELAQQRALWNQMQRRHTLPQQLPTVIQPSHQNQVNPVNPRTALTKPKGSWLPTLIGIGLVGAGAAMAVKLYFDYKKNQQALAAHQ